MAKSPTLVIRILADASQAARGMASASSNASKWATGMRRAMIPAAGVIVALGAMGKAAAEDAQGQAILANTLRKSTGATTAQVAATEDWISKTTLATGIADDQLRPALAALARSTGDVSVAQKAMSAVMDTSVATGKDVESVATAVAKAYAGNTAALGKLVPGLSKAVLKSGDMNAIMAELASKTGGAAAAAADTAAGKWQRAQVAFAETKESIGAGLLPVLETLSGRLVTVGTWVANNTTTVITLAVVLGGLAAAVTAVNAVMAVYTAYTTVAAAVTKLFAEQGLIARTATMAWTAAQWLLNVAMTANPVGLVIVAIIALIAAVVIAYKKSATFRAIVQGAWQGVKTAIFAVWQFLKTYVFGPYVAYLKLLWQGAKLAADGIGNAFQAVKGVLASVWNWIKSNIINPWIAAFNAVKDAVQRVIDMIRKIKIPAAVQKIFGGGKAVTPSAGYRPPPAPPPAPMPARRRRTATPRAAAADTTADRRPSALRDLTNDPAVIVQVSDRKMADLIDVRLRASATSAARNLTRRRVVTV